jgi:hypothetical protein
MKYNIESKLPDIRFFTGRDNATIFGIRFASTKQNKFDDLVGISINDTCVAFDATTSPGTFWLNNPSRVSGTARLIPGFYKACWRLGLHKGKTPALVQSDKAQFLVERDGDKDSDFDSTGKVFTDVQGLNCHPAGEASTVVDKWSAGCQVIAKNSDFNEFLNLVKLDKVSTYFSYQLVLRQDRDEFFKS